jgi:N utilization substance protein B
MLFINKQEKLMENNKSVNRRSFSRLFACQVLFSYFFSKDGGNSIEDLVKFMEEDYIIDEYFDGNFDEYKKNVSSKFLQELLGGVIKNIDAINLFIDNALTGKYTPATIDKFIMCILRLAVYEFRYTETDKKIIINEYVDIAGEYFDEKGVNFVNAILNKLSKN